MPTTLSKTATALSDRATTLSKTGVDGTVIDIFQRGGEVIPTGECTVVGPTGWWEVLRTDGSESGWVSSKFLSPEPLTDVGNPEFNPGRGKDSPAPEFIGVSAPTLDDLVSELASQFGFDSDVVITPVGEPTGNDATSGTARYDLTGFKDDSLDGYHLWLDFFINRDEANDGAVLEVEATGVVRAPLCKRGVTDDGLCT